MASIKCKLWGYKNDKILIFYVSNEKFEVKTAFVAVADKAEAVAKEVQIFLKNLKK